MNEEDQLLAWTIDSTKGNIPLSFPCSDFLTKYLSPHCLAVYNNLVTTALRYTPLVSNHHCPVKELHNGKLYVPLWPGLLSSIPVLKTLKKPPISHFHDVLRLLSQLTDVPLIQIALKECAKLVPYAISSRKAVFEGVFGVLGDG